MREISSGEKKRSVRRGGVEVMLHSFGTIIHEVYEVPVFCDGGTRERDVDIPGGSH